MLQRRHAQSIDRISVCICTFRRPHLLSRLLDALAEQVDGDRFAFNVVVVDNDRARSAQSVVRDFVARTRIPTVYDVEPERNIALTRNRAVRNAEGNLIAFIDDDERPVRDWLARMHETLRSNSAVGVLGPVLPDFPAAAPAWLKRGRVFDRQRHVTGTRISAADARTGNVLLERSLFVDGELWFDPAFGRTGGEDSDFFARHLRGNLFVWCDEAVAYEEVPPDRWTDTFHIKRLWRAGTLDGEWMREGRLPAHLVIRNVAVLSVCLIAVLPSFVLPKHLRMRVLQKLAYCTGVLTAYAGVSMFRDRE